MSRADTGQIDARAGWGTRASGLTVAAASAGLLILASGLTPAAEGHGTHTALGLPPCTWAAVLEQPCPTCGMTTAFAHAANGSLLTAFLVQPFGFVLAMGTATAFWCGMHVGVTGSRIWGICGRMMTPRMLWLVAALAAAAWAYKFATWPGR